MSKDKERRSKDNDVMAFLGLLGIAFIVLKLCNVIDWSWWWVLSPIWIPFALAGIILVVVFVKAIITAIIRHNRRKKKYGKREDKIDIE